MTLIRIILVSLALTASLHGEEKGFKILQPFRAGQRFSVSTVAEDSRRVSITERAEMLKFDKRSQRVEMIATVTVLEVNSLGEPTKELYKVFSLTDTTIKQAVVPTGTEVLVIRGTEKTTYSISGQAVATNLLEAFDLSLRIGIVSPFAGDSTIDVVGQSRVGKSWNLTLPEMLLGKFSDLGTVHDLGGKVTLKSIKTESGTPVAHMTTKLVGRFTLALDGVPDSLTNMPTKVTVTGTAAFPEDCQKRHREESMTLSAEFTGTIIQKPYVRRLQLLGNGTRSVTLKVKLIE